MSIWKQVGELALTSDESMCVNLVLEKFDGDEDRTLRWFTSPHAEIGYVTPISLMQRHRGATLLAVIRAALEIQVTEEASIVRKGKRTGGSR